MSFVARKRMADELAKAVTKVIYPVLKLEGFKRVRKRDLIRVENGIAQVLNFQVSAWGSRDFCVTACANLVAAEDHPTLAPGFRLTRDTDGGGLWLPSRTPEEAISSAEVMLGSIQSEALPYFEAIRTPAGFSALLAREQWSSQHHLSFRRGVSAALEGDAVAAKRHTTEAIELYQADGADWCGGYISKANALLAALAVDSTASLLADWQDANSKAHGIL
jgi:hypothetical protein